MIAKAEAAMASVLITTPWWASVLADVNLVATTIATVSGAIVGVHAVWKMWKTRKRK